MKKLIALMMAVLCMTSLVACGQKTNEPVKIPDGMVINGSEDPTQPGEPVTEPEEETTPSEEETQPEETQKPEEETKPEEVKPETEVKASLVLAEGSELNPAAEFNGLYEINGYARMAFMGNLSFSMGMKGVNVENSGEVDASKANLPEMITDIGDYVYFKLEFDGTQISAWDVVDRKTNESILHLSDDELTEKYFPEAKFEIVDAGDMPEVINLSNYPAGKTYAFNAPNNNNFSIPTIINDSDTQLLVVSIKNGIDDEFEREYKPNKYAPDNSSGSTYSEDGKYYMAVIEGDAAELMATDECFLLEGLEVGAEIDFDFEDFVGNNTDKTVTIVVEDFGEETEITLLPGEVAYCNWMNDVTIKEIK